jgi:hypothetical protein
MPNDPRSSELGFCSKSSRRPKGRGCSRKPPKFPDNYGAYLASPITTGLLAYIKRMVLFVHGRFGLDILENPKFQFSNCLI